MAVTTPFSTPGTGTGWVNFGINGGFDLEIPPITGYVPQLGDAVYVFGNQQDLQTMYTDATWAVGSTTVASATHMVFLRGHVITSAEVAAGTNSWLLPGLFASNGNGRGTAVVVRGGDVLSAPVVGTAFSGASAAVAPPSVTPDRDGALILSYVAPDDRGRGIGDPSIGWSVLQKTSSVNLVPSQLLMRRSTNAAGGVPVDMTNAAVTLGTADEWASITVAISPPASTSGFFAVFS